MLSRNGRSSVAFLHSGAPLKLMGHVLEAFRSFRFAIPFRSSAILCKWRDTEYVSGAPCGILMCAVGIMTMTKCPYRVALYPLNSDDLFLIQSFVTTKDFNRSSLTQNQPN